MVQLNLSPASLFAVLSLVVPVLAFDNTRFDNLAVYWGQNSYGATHSDTANFQKTLSFYCSDNTIDAIPVAFVTTFFGTGGLPVLNLANICNNVDNTTFPGSALANCASLASSITTCQGRGKIVTLSLGGAGGSVGFTSDAQAQSFADQIWNLFLGGSSSTRPFGSAILDGVDLDIEGGSNSGYAAFVNRLRTHFSGASKKYYITAAPQCPYPDASLGSVLNAASFDAVYVQFYNNFCGLQNFPVASDWDFGLWDNWARTISPNKAVKIYLGAPASPTAAGGGYQAPATLSSISTQMRKSFPSFGGVMLWDASQAFANSRYDQAIKNALVAAGGTGFTFPQCTAPAFVAGTNYPGGSQVSFGGYVWQAKFFASNTPANDPNNEWSAITACAGSAPSGPSSTTSRSSSSSSSSTAVPTSGNCASVAAWSSSVAYEGGSQVTSGGHLWTAKWWSQGDIPGGAAGDWTDNGVCATAKVLSTKPAAATIPSKTGIVPKPTFTSVHSSPVKEPTTNSTAVNGTASRKENKEAIQPRRPGVSRFFRL